MAKIEIQISRGIVNFCRYAKTAICKNVKKNITVMARAQLKRIKKRLSYFFAGSVKIFENIRHNAHVFCNP